MNIPILEVKELTTGYGKHEPVLKDISFSVQPGEALGIVGMNGAGKTSLMRAISGGLPPREGEILLEGASIVGLTTAVLARRGLVILPEGHRVLRPLTVAENLEVATMSLRRPRVRRRLRETEELIADLFPVLAERRNQLAGLLSGGEQQMLSLARAIVQDPKMLLLDEPSLGLAPRVIDRIYASLESLRSHGISLLIVEQNSERVAARCSHLVVLRDGRIAAEGSPEVLSGSRLTTAYFG